MEEILKCYVKTTVIKQYVLYWSYLPRKIWREHHIAFYRSDAGASLFPYPPLKNPQNTQLKNKLLKKKGGHVFFINQSLQ